MNLNRIGAWLVLSSLSGLCAPLGCGDDSSPSGSGGSGGGGAASSTTQSSSSSSTATASAAASTTQSSSTGDATCETSDDCGGNQMICAVTNTVCDASAPKTCVFFPPTCGEGRGGTACTCEGKSVVAGGCPSDTGFDSRPGACAPPAGKIYCGPTLCNAGTEYCLFGESDQPSCAPLPGGCTECACLPNAQCCAKREDGVLEAGCGDQF